MKVNDLVRIRYFEVFIDRIDEQNFCVCLSSEDMDYIKEGGYPSSWDSSIHITACHSVFNLTRVKNYKAPPHFNGSHQDVMTNLRYDVRMTLEGESYQYTSRFSEENDVTSTNIIYVVALDNKFFHNGIYYLIPAEDSDENAYGNEYSNIGNTFGANDIEDGKIAKSRYIKKIADFEYVYDRGSEPSDLIGMVFPGEAFWGKIVHISEVDNNLVCVIELYDGILCTIHMDHLVPFNISHEALNDLSKNKVESDKELNDLPFNSDKDLYDEKIQKKIEKNKKKQVLRNKKSKKESNKSKNNKNKWSSLEDEDSGGWMFT